MAPDSPREADVKLTQNRTSTGTAGTCRGQCRGPNPKTRARSLLPRPRSMATAVRSGHIDVAPETQDGSVQKSGRLVSTLTERRRARKTVSSEQEHIRRHGTPVQDLTPATTPNPSQALCRRPASDKRMDSEHAVLPDGPVPGASLSQPLIRTHRTDTQRKESRRLSGVPQTLRP